MRATKQHTARWGGAPAYHNKLQTHRKSPVTMIIRTYRSGSAVAINFARTRMYEKFG